MRSFLIRAQSKRSAKKPTHKLMWTEGVWRQKRNVNGARAAGEIRQTGGEREKAGD